MKTICLFSYQRTGSSWLCDIMADGQTISLQEIFSKDPMLFSHAMSLILNKIYEVEPNIINTFNKIYSTSNFFIDPITYIKIKNNILEKKPYSIDLLKNIQNIIYKKKYNMIFKIFPEHLDMVSINDILSITNINIINYRNNLLDSFISEKKSLLSQKWTSIQKERKYLEKIKWDEKEYIKYCDIVINKLNYFQNNINKYVLISYEEIHTNKNKNEFIKNKIKYIYNDFDLNFKRNSILEKENYIINTEDNFINKEEFLLSIKNIRTKIYE